MSTIDGTSLMNSLTNTSSAAPKRTPASAVDTGQIANKETFLKLLVAQIKNQNPLNPTDGAAFLTQLAQFSELEQMMGMRTDLQTIGTKLDQPAQAGQAPAGSATDPAKA
jgi:flagellar basal-body rod modification protein FlgD